MSSLKKSRSNTVMGLIVAFIAGAVFALPQGVCLKTLLGNTECCSSLADVDVASNADSDSCCQKSHNGVSQKNKTNSHSSAPDTYCMGISTAPFLQSSSHSAHEIVSLAPVILNWISLVDIQPPNTIASLDFLDKELASPALRRGSSILRI